MKDFLYVLQIRPAQGEWRDLSVLEREIKIGRRPENNVVLKDKKVSGKHALLLCDLKSLQVVDLGSRNGTYLNKHLISPHKPTPVEIGDVITIGSYALRAWLRPQVELEPPVSSRSTGIDKRVCKSCHAPLRSKVRFCAYCGATVDIAPPPSHPQDAGQLVFMVRCPGKSPFEYPLDRSVLHVGRVAENDIVLDYTNVSARHLKITLSQKAVRVTDLGSTNGTQVNGRFIQPHVAHTVRPGDVIRIGSRYGNSLSMRLKQRHDVSLRVQPLGMQTLAKFSYFTIGRASSCQLTLDHPMVSREHAEIVRQDAGHSIRDLGGMNGTFINGKRVVGREMLHTGDVIQIGPFRLVYDGQVQSLATAISQGHRLDALKLGRQVKSGHMILRDISLAVQGGEFIALVGGSGAGKSTLVKAMNGFIPATHGRMLINGEDLYANLDAYRTLMAYVPQDDIIHKRLPVHLALWYAAKLRLPDATPREIEQRIATVLEAVDMTQHAQKPVYVLSGGQRKRVSIAVELLSQPELLFLDEPTSGLDPGLEKKMMYDLNRLADQGQTVVLVTHATANIEQCDHVAFLVQGRLAYYGPPREAIDYFEAQDFADIYLKLSQDADATTWDKKYRHSSICQRYVKERQAPLAAGRPAQQGAAPERGRPTRTRDSALRQVGVLARRQLDLIRHDWITLFILLIMMPVISLLFMAVSNQDDLTGWQMSVSQIEERLQTKLEDENADVGESESYMPEPTATQLITMLGLALTQAGTFGAAFEIVKERAIFLRERSVNLRPSAYVVAKILVLGMFAVIQVGSSMLILNLKVSMDFNPILDFFPIGSLELFVTLLLGVIASIMLGLFISAMVPSSDIVLYIILGQLFAQIILSGAMFPLDNNIASKLVISHWTMEAMGATIDVNKLNEESLTCSVIERPSETGDMVRDFDCRSSPRPADELGLDYTRSREHLLTAWAALFAQTVFWGILTMIVQTRKKLT